MRNFFIVATKDRPNDLRKMLRSLADQSVRPDGVIIVDGSDDPVKAVVDEFAAVLSLNYIRHRPPSASAQRNAGVRALPPEAGLAGFLDDDVALEPDALERMMAFWDGAPADLGGCAFNMMNHPVQAFSRLKRGRIVKRLGIYDAKSGCITPSGWQTLTGRVEETTYVDWLPSTAALWRSEILRTSRFDEFFDGYSYLEDLDFSFTVRRRWRLAVVADARYNHYPSPIRHVQQYSFGQIEVRNRLYFVRKHGLSVPRCWLGLLLRMGMSIGHSAVYLDRGAFSRALGNCTEMLKAATNARLARPHRAAD